MIHTTLIGQHTHDTHYTKVLATLYMIAQFNVIFLIMLHIP